MSPSGENTWWHRAIFWIWACISDLGVRVSRSRSRDEGCSALRNRLIGSRLQTA
ncbi:hypothetical protein [Pasteuria penetrans]|uniref:hypothetical protein n=1 Tax=Pasteuria penetrans TaxID=86005 RepID=UPI00165B1B39|nr:hypothetical protein [Pasteuria penetrans]